jgi:hypothetical protein
VGRRFLLALAGWLAAAVLATLVGLGAIQVISAGITRGEGDVTDPAEVARALAETSARPSADGGTPASSTSASRQPADPGGTPAPDRSSPDPPDATVVSRTFRTVGGTVRARCSGATARLVTWAPASGYRVHKAERGARREARVEFRGERGEVRIDVICSGGVPEADVEVKD